MIIKIFTLLTLLGVYLTSQAKEVVLKDGKLKNLMDIKTINTLNRTDFFDWENNYLSVQPYFGLPFFYPQLDQGRHGTCVTFATTAAIGDKMGLKEDVISQQCFLALSTGLGNNIFEGAYYPKEVFEPLKTYGVVKKDDCPLPYPNPSHVLQPQEYQKLIDYSLSASVLSIKYSTNLSPDLRYVKTAIDAGNKVLIAFTLNANSQNGVSGYDVNGKKGGLWACYQYSSPFEYNCGNFNSGHEVVVSGYDDSQQLLKIRNSWGYDLGENGDFFMTYKFFKMQVMDATVVFSQ